MTLELTTRINPHIVSLGALLNSNPSSQYRVPVFQRPYSWTDLEVQAFLDDLDDAIANEVPYYYLGSMVLIEEERDCLRIIDGQQRMATTQILISRIMHRLLQDDPNDNAVMRYTTYFQHEDSGGHTRDTLVLNDPDRNFFAKHVIQREPLPHRTSISVVSNAAIADAIETVDEFIKDKFENVATQEKRKEYLTTMVGFINRKLAVLRVICADLELGYTLFRSLNARGKDLSPVDLVRNHILQKTASDPSTIDMWQSAIQEFDDVDSPDVTDFLRHQWIARQKPVRVHDLARAVESRIATRAQAEDYLIRLVDDAALYSALTKSNHPFWGKVRDVKAKWSVAGIIDQVNLKQVRPLLIVCCEKLQHEPEELANLLSMFCGWAVRGLVLRTWSKGAMEQAVGDATGQLRDLSNISTEQVYQTISHMVPNDVQFTKALDSRIFTNKMARFILGAVENYRRLDELPDRDVSRWVDVGDLWVEHVLPRTPDKRWWSNFYDESGDITEETKFRMESLGNLTLLSGARNRSLSNAAFSTKKSKYADSDLLITKNLAQVEEWTSTEIDRRQIDIAEWVCKAWPVWPTR